MSDTELETPAETDPDETTEAPADDEPGRSDDEQLEQDDEENERGEPAGDDEPAQARGLTPEALEKRARAAERRFTTYTGSISSLYEDEAQYLTPCPLCPDQHKGFVDVRQAGYVPQEIQDAVRMYFGIARQRDYPRSHQHRTCNGCQGEGKVSTGSHVPEHETITCPDCGGRGYLGPELAAPTNGTVVTGPTVLGHDIPVTQAFEDRDEWDEPRILPDGRENPNFGRMPNRKVPVEPWGITAGLNALSSV